MTHCESRPARSPPSAAAGRSERWREASKASLRRAQWRAALKGNPTMLIWLGKQELGQRNEPLGEPNASTRDGEIRTRQYTTLFGQRIEF